MCPDTLQGLLDCDYGYLDDTTGIRHSPITVMLIIAVKEHPLGCYCSNIHCSTLIYGNVCIYGAGLKKLGECMLCSGRNSILGLIQSMLLNQMDVQYITPRHRTCAINTG